MKSASQNVQWEKWALVTGQWVWLFHYCGENDQRYISCMSAPTAPFFFFLFLKSRTNENWVRTCLQVLTPTTGLRNVWWRKRYCLWSIYWDRRIGILFRLSALSQAAPGHWCLFAQLLLLRIQCRDTRRPLLKVNPRLWWPQCNNDPHILSLLLCAQSLYPQ